MRRQVILSERADADLDSINGYYLFQVGEAAAVRIFEAIMRKIDYIARNALSGSPIPGMPQQFRTGLIKKYKYKIYYEVLDDNAVKIIMIRHTSRKPPSPQAIRSAARK